MRFLTLIILPLTLVLGCSDKGTDSGSGDRTADILALTPDAANGATVYGSVCSSCHAADGAGDFGPSLQGLTDSDEELVATILNGKEAMPAYADELSDQEIADVLAHIKSL